MERRGYPGNERFWYTGPPHPPPFSLVHAVPPATPPYNDLRSAATFPWSAASFHTLFEGYLAENYPSLESEWIQTVTTFEHTVVFGGRSFVRIQDVRRGSTQRPYILPLKSMQKERGHESLYPVAWALRSKPPLDPLVLCAHDRMLYAFNVKSRQFVAEIRGHGNSITSIAVEATHPSIVCTTSRDFSARIIDLDMEPRQEPNNPPMPPSKVPNLAGAPVGLQMTGREGNGFGRCLAVLAGGRAGGHQAAVMGAAFHHTFPLIATCGMDRAVKIWRLPLLSNPDVFSREDKPIFSSSRIHDARVLSVSWLSDDVLLTHSAPASLRRDPDDVQSLYTQDGQAIVWQWIGLHRFFPPDKGAAAWPNAARPCASDYQESTCFEFLSRTSLPQHSPHMHVHHMNRPVGHPVLLVPHAGVGVRIINISRLSPTESVPFSVAQELMEEPERASGPRLTSLSHYTDLGDPSASPMPPPSLLEGSGWVLLAPAPATEQAVACAMGRDGNLIVVLGSLGSIWIYAYYAGSGTR